MESVAELGYVEGRNLRVERRYADGRLERLPALAAELVQRRVDVVVASGSVAVQAAQEATKTIPIVILMAGADPVELGMMASPGPTRRERHRRRARRRPGGQASGAASGDHSPRNANRDARPSRGAGGLGARLQVLEAEEAAKRLGVTLIVVPAPNRAYEQAFATMVTERAGSLFVSASPILNGDRARIIALAARHRLPAIYQWSEHVREPSYRSIGPRWATTQAPSASRL